MNAELLQPRIPGVEWTLNAAAVTADLDFDQYQEIFRQASIVGDASRWWLGDLLLYGERRYGEEAAQVYEVARVSHDSLVRYRHVCEKITPPRRRGNLSFSHHIEVVTLEPQQQTRMLDRAEQHGWSVAELRQEVQATKSLDKQHARRSQVEVLPANPVVEAVEGFAVIREAIHTTYSHLKDPEKVDALTAAETFPAALKALDKAEQTIAAAAKTSDAREAYMTAVRLCRDALTEIVAFTHEQPVAVPAIQHTAAQALVAAANVVREYET